MVVYRYFNLCLLEKKQYVIFFTLFPSYFFCLFYQLCIRGHCLVIVQMADYAVRGTDVDARYAGMGKKLVYRTVGLWRIGHCEVLFGPETRDAFCVFLSGDAYQPKIFFSGKMAVYRIYSRKFLAAVATSGMEKHHHRATAQQRILRDPMSVCCLYCKGGQGVAHCNPCAFLAGYRTVLFCNTGRAYGGQCETEKWYQSFHLGALVCVCSLSRPVRNCLTC